MPLARITARVSHTHTFSILALILLLTVPVGCQRVSEPQDPVRSVSMHDAAQSGQARSVFIEAGEAGPVLTVTNEYIDTIISTSLNQPATIMDVPAKQPLTFCWTADASPTGGVVEAYRYGWDILDLNDPGQWEIDFTPFDGSQVCSPTRDFSFGTHSLHIEVTNDLGARSRMGIIVNTTYGPPTFDVMPGSCKNPLSPRKTGVIVAAIPGTFGVDVRDIDISTLSLRIDGGTNVEPLRTRIGDVASPLINGDFCGCPPHGADGIDDLLLHFSAADVNEALGPVTKGEVREIGIEGSMVDGSIFGIFDCVTIVGMSKAEGQTLPQTRDAVLATLEEAYNRRDLKLADVLFDSDFTFYFSEEDFQEGDVPVSQWGRESEITATANLFGAIDRAVARHTQPMTNVAPNGAMVEASTWGLIKYLFFEDPTLEATSIGLSLVYPPGEDTWVQIVPPGPTPPDEQWFEKMAFYQLIVQVGDTTYITGSSVRTLFVVRSAETDDGVMWQLVGWRDDI